jgi:tRNA(fMet)-specific endonuclease VapC
MSALRFMLDTNLCIYLLAGRSPDLTQRVGNQPSGSVGISAITLGELMVGGGSQTAASPELASLIDELPVIPFDDAAARTYGRLPFRRGSFDRLIAAHALSLGLVLVTNNERDFSDLSGLGIENWTKP